MATSITQLAKDAVKTVLRAGDAAVDATLGNGYDAAFLAECVGETGLVFGFDVQAAAVATSTERLAACGFRNFVFVQASHAELSQRIPAELHGKIRAVMFNLGYLPGADKSVITHADSTVSAVRETLKLLAAGGVCTVVVYPGHAGGAEEAEAVRVLLNSLPEDEFAVDGVHSMPGRTEGPTLWVVRKSFVRE